MPETTRALQGVVQRTCRWDVTAVEEAAREAEWVDCLGWHALQGWGDVGDGYGIEHLNVA